MPEDKAKRYPIVCPGCGAQHDIAKSIFQETFGMYDLGSCICPKCKMHIHCSYIPESDRMEVVPYSEWWEHYKSDPSHQVGYGELEK